MSYDLNWNSKHPGHIVYLIDLSGSMARTMNGKRLIDIVMDVMYSLFDTLNDEILSGNGVVDLFSATVIGYNSDVYNLLPSASAERFNRFVFESKKRGYLFNTQKGGDAEPNWQTFMADAFDAAAKDIREWIDTQNRKGVKIPAPVVINITDGEPYEGTGVDAVGKALNAANRLKSISTPDGNTLVYNIHFTPDSNATKIVLPDTPPTNKYARFLYDASSVIPASLIDNSKAQWPSSRITANSRAMISNENDVDSLLSFISWGTSTGGVDTSDVTFIEIPKPR